jgi:DNA-binding XRE family transcriptional regulator
MAWKFVEKKWTATLIKQLRGKRTQEEFARLIGAPKNTVWRWEAGRVAPAAAYAKKLSELAQRERLFLDWEPVGSITWIGDLQAGWRQIARDFYRSIARGPHGPGRSKNPR